MGASVKFAGGSTEFDIEGFVGGGHVGYNVQNGSVVFGIVADVNFADLDDSAVVASTTNTIDIDFTASVRGKFGGVVDRALLYGTAGLAIADIEHTNQFGASPTLTHSNTYVGLTAGAGIDLAITDMITGFVEYRYTVYGDESVGPRTVGAFNFASHDVEVAFHQIQAGISIRLGNWLGGGN